MSLTETAPVEPYASRPNRIDKLTPKVRKAIDLMVWDGKTFIEAAAQVGLTSQAMRLALGKPFVLAAMKHEMQILRSSMLPRNIQRLAEIRDAADNMPAIQAVRTLLDLDNDGSKGSSSGHSSPGVTIKIVTIGAPLTQSQPVIIDNDEIST